MPARAVDAENNWIINHFVHEHAGHSDRKIHVLKHRQRLRLLPDDDHHEHGGQDDDDNNAPVPPRQLILARQRKRQRRRKGRVRGGSGGDLDGT